jgi:putative transcriptional regulator
MKFLRKVKPMLTDDATPATETHQDIAVTLMPAPQPMDSEAQNGYLTGQLLVATPVIESGPFAKSVVYMFNHSVLGATGLIINQPIEIMNYTTLLEGMNLPNSDIGQELPVFIGGPVERGRGFVLHSGEYYRDFSLSRSGEIAVTANSAIVRDIVLGQGPRHAALIVGCASWHAGQLEQEIEQNAWISLPATQALVFGTESDLKWATASKSLGIDMNFYSTAVGHA